MDFLMWGAQGLMLQPFLPWDGFLVGLDCVRFSFSADE